MTGKNFGPTTATQAMAERLRPLRQATWTLIQDVGRLVKTIYLWAAIC